MQIMMKSWWFSLFRKFTLPCSSQHMFLHMEYFSLLCSVAAGSRGHLGGWEAPLSYLYSALGEVGSKTGPRSLYPDFWQSSQFAWCTDLFAHGLLNSLSHGLFPPVLHWAALEAASPPCLCPSGNSKTNSLLFFSSAVCLQEKKNQTKTSLCSFCFLNGEKEQYPNPLTLIGSMAVFRQAQILSPPCRVIWEYHYNSADFMQQYFLSVLPWKTSCYWILTKLLMESLEAMWQDL